MSTTMVTAQIYTCIYLIYICGLLVLWYHGYRIINYIVICLHFSWCMNYVSFFFFFVKKFVFNFFYRYFRVIVKLPLFTRWWLFKYVCLLLYWAFKYFELLEEIFVSNVNRRNRLSKKSLDCLGAVSFRFWPFYRKIWNNATGFARNPKTVRFETFTTVMMDARGIFLQKLFRELGIFRKYSLSSRKYSLKNKTVIFNYTSNEVRQCIGNLFSFNWLLVLVNLTWICKIIVFEGLEG